MRRFLILLILIATPAVANADPSTLAILYFDNQGNEELEPLKVGLAQMLITDIKGTEGVTVVERARLQDILDELELGHSGMADPNSAAKVGKLLGARWMLIGSYFELMGTLRIDARLVKVETSEIVHADGVNGATENFMQMEGSLATSFRGALGTVVLEGASYSPTDPGPTGVADGSAGGAGDASADDGATGTKLRSGGDDDAAAGATSNAGTEVVKPDAKVLDAALAFSEGLIFLDRDDVSRARESFEQAVASNPDLDAAKEALAAIEI